MLFLDFFALFTAISTFVRRLVSLFAIPTEKLINISLSSIQKGSSSSNFTILLTSFFNSSILFSSKNSIANSSPSIL